MQKKLLLISMILIVLCSLSAVSASEINGTDDAIGVDSDVSAPCDIVGASEINGTDDAIGVDSDVSAPCDIVGASEINGTGDVDSDSNDLSEPSSTDTVSKWLNYDEELIGLCNIYFYTAENKVYVINEAPEPQIPEISGGAVVYVENTTLGEGDGKIMMYFYGDNGPVDGSVDVYFNDTKYNAVIGNGVAILNAGSELSYGIYDIYYEYLGGTNYAPSSKVKTDSKFEVGKRDVNITFRVDIASKKIYFEFTDEITPTGRFSYQIDDGRVYKKSLGKTHSFDRLLANGTHTITITYLGDDNHTSKTVVDTFDIIKRQPTCNITRDAGNFKFDFTEEVGNEAKITVDFVGPNSFSEGSGWSSTDGIITMDVSSKLLNGSYNLTVHLDYYGVKFFENVDFNYTFDYIKYTISNMTVIPEVPTKPIGTTSTITVVVNVAEGDPVPTGSVSYKAGSATFPASLNENGIAKVRWEIWEDQVGSFVRTFTYSGDKNYETASMDVTLVCEPSLNVKLQTENNNVTFSFNDDYNYDNYGVVHIIDNGEYLGNVTGDGSFPNFKASDLDLGEHTFEIIWENTDGHNYTFTESAFLRISGLLNGQILVLILKMVEILIIPV